ncbi:MAG: 3,4-dihydroxy-2-butanone-4-phosphate synthase [Candidatus Bathyarchaeia archaeon]
MSVNFENVAETLRLNRPILIYDCDGREEETDMIMAAENITPELVAMLRRDAGGLLCVAIKYETAQKLAVPSMIDILRAASSKFPMLAEMTAERSPYGDRPAFSITVNHRDAYTGVTDIDRALTIKGLAKVVRDSANGRSVEELRGEMASMFKSPGHLHLLIADRHFLSNRRGHTELSLALLDLCGFLPISVVCEMLDGSTGRALSHAAAEKFASTHSLPFLSGADVLEAYERSAVNRRMSLGVEV